ncbi:hypothetical protein [Calothrix sp. 336/3]|uniref:hypothetical protein n=1 Tax=Calothrix sp. 336/3 TaxID=1337936 RepID=UPI0004E2C71C|nr:hypothetical protein [Calothrix sp. 336/3]AKG22636.1 hypothetical protein IJ00_16365 [Calothrix sp. 336/3]
MSHFQSQDLFAIAGVSNLNQESAAAVSGGTLTLSDFQNGKGTVAAYNSSRTTLGGFNNKASWYRITGKRDWIVYVRTRFGGTSFRLKAGSSGNLFGVINNNIESIKLV